MNILSPEFVAAIGLFLGVLARISIPYLIKIWTGEIKQFQIYYLWQALAGLALSAIVVILVAPNMLINPDANFFQLIFANAIIGLGSTELISEIFTLRDLKKETPAVATPPPTQ
jgi:hypothetical protein